MRADRIALLLPEVYRRTIVPGTPIASLIGVMEQLHAPVEAVLAELPVYFDPQRTPDRFVPFLARWVDLDRWMDEGSDTFDSGVGRLRQVVAAAARLSRLRGTAEGLRDALELAIGVAGVRIEEGATDAAGRQRPYHAVVTLPAEAATHDMLVRRIVAQEKPAHVTVDIVYANGAPTAEPAATAGDGAASAGPPAPTLPVTDDRSSEPAFPGTERIPVMTGVPEVAEEDVAPAPIAPPSPAPAPPPAPAAPAPPASAPPPPAAG